MFNFFKKKKEEEIPPMDYEQDEIKKLLSDEGTDIKELEKELSDDLKDEIKEVSSNHMLNRTRNEIKSTLDKVKTVSEFYEIIKDLNNVEFSLLREDPDFRKWIGKIINDQALALELQLIKNKDVFLKKISDHIEKKGDYEIDSDNQLIKKLEKINFSDKITPEQALKFLSDTTIDHYFLVHGSMVVKNLEELQENLEYMPERIFGLHVNLTKNEFYDWIRNAIGDTELAEAIKDVKSREQMSDILKQRINQLREVGNSIYLNKEDNVNSKNDNKTKQGIFNKIHQNITKINDSKKTPEKIPKKNDMNTLISSQKTDKDSYRPKTNGIVKNDKTAFLKGPEPIKNEPQNSSPKKEKQQSILDADEANTIKSKQSIGILDYIIVHNHRIFDLMGFVAMLKEINDNYFYEKIVADSKIKEWLSKVIDTQNLNLMFKNPSRGLWTQIALHANYANNKIKDLKDPKNKPSSSKNLKKKTKVNDFEKLIKQAPVKKEPQSKITNELMPKQEAMKSQIKNINDENKSFKTESKGTFSQKPKTLNVQEKNRSENSSENIIKELNNILDSNNKDKKKTINSKNQNEKRVVPTEIKQDKKADLQKSINASNTENSSINKKNQKIPNNKSNSSKKNKSNTKLFKNNKTLKPNKKVGPDLNEELDERKKLMKEIIDEISNKKKTAKILSSNLKDIKKEFQRVKSLKSEISHLIEKKEILTTQNFKEQKALKNKEELKSSIENLSKKYNENLNKATKIREQMERLLRERDDTERELNNKKEELNETVAHLYSSKNQANSLNQEVLNLKQIHNNEIKQIENAKKELESINQKIDENKRILQQDYNIDAIKEKWSELSVKLEQLNKETIEKDTELELSNQKISQKNNEIQELVNKSKELESIIKKYEQKIEELEITTKNTEENLKEKNIQLNEMENEVTLASGKLKDINDEFENKRIQLSNFTDRIATLKKSVKEEETKRNNASSEFLEIKKEIENVTPRLKEQRSIFNKIENEISDLNSEKEINENKIKSLIDQIEELKEEKEKESTALYNLKQEEDDRKRKISDFNIEIDKKQKEKDFLNLTVANSKKLLEEKYNVDRAKQEVEELSQKIESLKRDKASLIYEIQSHKLELNKITASLEKNQTELKNLKSKNEKIENEIEDKTASVKEMDSIIKDKKTELSSLESDISDRSNELQNLKQEILKNLQIRKELEYTIKNELKDISPMAKSPEKKPIQVKRSIDKTKSKVNNIETEIKQRVEDSPIANNQKETDLERVFEERMNKNIHGIIQILTEGKVAEAQKKIAELKQLITTRKDVSKNVIKKIQYELTRLELEIKISEVEKNV